MPVDDAKRQWIRQVLGIDVSGTGRAAPRSRSVLPEPPAELTPQGRAMVKAAARGALFCEECDQRSAAAREAANVG
jgi:hypothetical protein